MLTHLTLRVAVVEDDPATRARFVAAITQCDGLAVAAQFGTGGEMLDWLSLHQPDVLLVDLGLPDVSGVHVIADCAARYPLCDIMVISMFGDEAHVLDSIEAGASGYLLKDSMDEEIGARVKELAAGGAPMSPLIARRVMRRFREVARGEPPPTAKPGVADLPSPLSDREREVLEYIARGFSYGEIGGLTKLSPLTVQTHIKRIYRKLAVHSKNEAVYEARHQGWIAQ